MAGRKYDLLIRASGDVRDAQRAMERLQRSVKNFGRGVRNVGIGLTAAVTTPLLLAARTGITELTAAQKAAAQTNAVIASTGGAAGVTSTHVTRLSDALLRMSGIDDQVIQGGANILLTFTKIGAKDGVFDRATRAALDLSVAFGKDMTSSSVLVGKALQDPIKGIGALSRVGIQFTDKQKAVIKKLVETGQTAKAQKIILRELERQVGGSAKAFGTTAAGAVGRLKERFASISAQMVTMLLPAFMKLADWLEKGMKWFEGLSKSQQKWIGITALIVGVVGPVLVALGTLITALAAVSTTVLIVVGGVAAYAAELAYLYNKSETFRGAVKRLGKGLATFLRAIRDVLGVVKSFAEWIARATARNENLRKGLTLFGDAVKTYVDHIAKVVSAVSDFAGGLLTSIKRSNTLREGFGFLGDAATLITDAISLAARANSALASAALSAAQAIAQKLSPAINALKTPIGWIRDYAGSSFSTFKTVVGGIDRAIGNVLGKLRDFVELIKSAVEKVDSLLKKANKLADIALPDFLGGGDGKSKSKPSTRLKGGAAPAVSGVSMRARGGASSPTYEVNITTTSNDTESIVQRIKFMIEHGQIRMKPGIA